MSRELRGCTRIQSFPIVILQVSSIICVRQICQIGVDSFSLSLWQRFGERAWGFNLSSATPLFASPSPRGRREKSTNEKFEMKNGK
jgi:hypothetical protein